MLYDFLNQKEYIDISKINTCSSKSINEIVRQYALLISRSFEHYIAPSYNKVLNITLIFDNEQECKEVLNEIKSLENTEKDKYILIEKILFKLKSLDIQYNFYFLPCVSQYKDSDTKIKGIAINSKNNFSFTIDTTYDFFVFIKLNVGAYSNDINKLVNYVLSYSIKKLNNLFEFDFTIKSMQDKSTVALYFNIYYQYEKNNKEFQYLLMTDIFANNPIKINSAFEEFQKYAYFDDILKF